MELRALNLLKTSALPLRHAGLASLSSAVSGPKVRMEPRSGRENAEYYGETVQHSRDSHRKWSRPLSGKSLTHISPEQNIKDLASGNNWMVAWGI